jgi:phage FluMu protein Com
VRLPFARKENQEYKRKEERITSIRKVEKEKERGSFTLSEERVPKVRLPFARKENQEYKRKEERITSIRKV